MLNTAEITAKLTVKEVNRLRSLGDLLQYAVPWAALLCVALEGEQLEAWRWLYIGSITAVTTHILKYLFDFTSLGKRPDGGDGSMPSGHTSSAFMGAWFFLFEYDLVAAVISLILAALTGYSRVVAKRHWVRDVIAAAILALLFNYLFFEVVEVAIPV